MVSREPDRDPSGASGNVNTLTLEDAEAIAGLSMVAGAVPELNTGATIVYENQTWTSQINGTTPGMQVIKDWPVSSGSYFGDDDVQSASLVAVLGQTVVDNLFPPGTDPVGATIRINKLAFTVVGVLSPKGAAMMGQDQDDAVYVPITTVQKRMLGVNNVRTINVQTETQDSMAYVQTSIEELLRERHRITGSKTDDFSVLSLTSVLEAAETATGTMTILLASTLPSPPGGRHRDYEYYAGFVTLERTKSTCAWRWGLRKQYPQPVSGGVRGALSGGRFTVLSPEPRWPGRFPVAGW